MKDSNIYKEIGLEREFFLLKKDETLPIEDRIVEPLGLEFPSDIFGFLCEILSKPWMHLNTVKMTWDMEESYWKHRADKFNLELSDLPFIEVSKEKGQYFFNKYHGDKYPDLTQNIYSRKNISQGQPKIPSHHLGMFFDNDKCLLTSGMHVHFSMRDNNGKVVPFTKEQIYKIVKYMDNAFKHDIKISRRIAGEWEPKVHGFEYRSLPANINVYKVLKHSFKILREV